VVISSFNETMQTKNKLNHDEQYIHNNIQSSVNKIRSLVPAECKMLGETVYEVLTINL
jgi:hypothetical protein